MSEALAWVAGFFDGEGHVGRSSKRNSLYLDVSQASLDGTPETLQRIQSIIGFGHLRGPYFVANRKPIYRYELSGHEAIQAFMVMIWPWLGEVKRADFARALTTWRASHRPRGYNQYQDRTTCGRGHEHSEHAVWTGKQWRCNTCVKIVRSEKSLSLR